MTLRERLEQAWYEGVCAPCWTFPLAALYGGIVRLRRQCYRMGLLKSVRLPVPVIVVGNLTVGGTGKTPLVIALAQALHRQGWRPGVVSRGYGGARARAVLLGAYPDPHEVGDEPCLIAQSGVTVAVGRDRPAAAQLLLEAGCDLVIADDGLQHYRLARAIEICVIDAARGFGNRRLLPAGPLREPLSRLREVDFRIDHGVAPEGAGYRMQLRGGDAVSLCGEQRLPLSAFRGKTVHALAGIGNPARFFVSLRAQGIRVIAHPFPDHHAYSAEDLAFGDRYPLLMTDKDAVKCMGFADERCWRVPVHAELEPVFYEQLQARLVALKTARQM